ncbi:uncharacterized protein TNCV_4954111 [Trichonephila clavipes]|nr:uncharacterized protein TNCV_4954111 [Trichonephila clavipes]
MTGGLPPLVGLHGGWRRTGMNRKKHTWNPAGNLLQWSTTLLNFAIRFVFFIVKTPDTFTNVSPFLIEKAFTSSIGEVKSIHVIMAPHTNMNFSRGVISPADFLNVSTEEIKENTKAQKVCDVRRITIRWDGLVLNTKHLILSFSTPVPPTP